MVPTPQTEERSYLQVVRDDKYNVKYLKEVPRPKFQFSANSRLHDKTTISASRFYGTNKEQPVHVDALDFSLFSVYDQTDEWLADTYKTLIQPESVELVSGTKECRPVTKSEVRPLLFNHPVYISPLTEKVNDINNIGLAIECPHISQTNNGYSRKKESGTFYRS